MAEGSAERVNRRTWNKPAVLRAFGDEASPRTEWWTDPGERAALLAVADAARGRPILEVGVGGGRLIAMLQLLSNAYVGIDYTPEMVELCRRLHPHVDIRFGDARDLGDFSNGAFGLVVFTFNGIDAMGHDERSVALNEFRRVLGPGGLLVLSTHNKAGPAYRATPWHRAGAPQRRSWPTAYRLERMAAAAATNPASFPRSVRNWLRGRALREDHGAWAIAPVEAHDFDLVIHFEMLSRANEELDAAGFELLAAFAAEDGRPLQPAKEYPDVRYFHLVARAKDSSE